MQELLSAHKCVRTTKIAGNEKHEYVTQNGKVVRELVTNKTTGAFIRCLDFLYDESGRPFAMRNYWNSSLSGYDTYHYILNAQGDVVQITYQGGTVKATYTYDAWGRVLTADGELAAMNPLRYRGYYYDTDTGFYYLQSRYYDPIIKRFLNADSYESTGQGFIGTNMFAYCNNNPVTHTDTAGYTVESVIAEGTQEYYINGAIVTINVEIVAKIPIYDHVTVNFSDSGIGYEVDVGDNSFSFNLKHQFTASSSQQSVAWKYCNSGIMLSLDLIDGVTVESKPIPLNEHLDMHISVSIKDATWYDDVLAWLSKPCGVGGVGWGAGSNIGYTGGGAVYADGGGLCGLGGSRSRFFAIV